MSSGTFVGTTSPHVALYTPSSTESTVSDDERSPDSPLPSIEGDISLGSPASKVLDIEVEESRVVRVSVGLSDGLHNLRLESVGSNANNEKHTSNTASSPKATRADSLVGAVNALNLGGNARKTRSDNLLGALDALRLSEGSKRGSPRCSPSPGRRHRARSSSSQHTNIHQVEDEAAPDSHFHNQIVQTALASAKEATRTIAQALSSSTLHTEPGSSIANLFHQATELSQFQPPSFRIVGLVGDSGVGKSSLINSMLDRAGFARAVSNHEFICDIH